MSLTSRSSRGKKQNDVPTTTPRSKSEERMIRLMTQKGGKGFRVLRSAETGLKTYKRKDLPAATPRPRNS
jgi:hypothetical protein